MILAFMKSRKNNKFSYPGRRIVIWPALVYYIYLSKIKLNV